MPLAYKGQRLKKLDRLLSKFVGEPAVELQASPPRTISSTNPTTNYESQEAVCILMSPDDMLVEFNKSPRFDAARIAGLRWGR